MSEQSQKHKHSVEETVLSARRGKIPCRALQHLSGAYEIKVPTARYVHRKG
jgi:hypothetical protein